MNQKSNEVQQRQTGRHPDHGLSAEQLDAKYNPNGDGEQPDYTRKMWRDAVEEQDTISGYWDWVVYKLDEASTYFGPG